MKPFYQDKQTVLYHGDCREVLPALGGGSVDVVITDPVWPNATADLAGSHDPYGLFAEAAREFPRLSERLVVQLGCDSDPRFLAGVPNALPFLRTAVLEYALPRPKGRILYTGDMAYVFGKPSEQRPGRFLAPGRMVSARADRRRPRRRLCERKAFEGHWTVHPCPRRLEHVAWLVRWFADGLVLDPFAGICTTLVAAKYGGYPAVGIEIDERFAEAGARRLEQGVLEYAT